MSFDLAPMDEVLPPSYTGPDGYDPSDDSDSSDDSSAFRLPPPYVDPYYPEELMPNNTTWTTIGLRLESQTIVSQAVLRGRADLVSSNWRLYQLSDILSAQQTYTGYTRHLLVPRETSANSLLIYRDSDPSDIEPEELSVSEWSRLPLPGNVELLTSIFQGTGLYGHPMFRAFKYIPENQLAPGTVVFDSACWEPGVVVTRQQWYDGPGESIHYLCQPLSTLPGNMQIELVIPYSESHYSEQVPQVRIERNILRSTSFPLIHHHNAVASPETALPNLDLNSLDITELNDIIRQLQYILAETEQDVDFEDIGERARATLVDAENIFNILTTSSALPDAIFAHTI